MHAADLLTALYSSGFTLDRDGARLLVGPADALTDELCAAITQHKPVLLAWLAAIGPYPVPGVVPDLAGDDLLESEALILAGLGCSHSARCTAECITDPARYQALLQCLTALAERGLIPTSPVEGVPA